MLEREIQKRIRSVVAMMGGFAIKNQPGPGGTHKGFPDLTVVLKDGRTIYVEVKQPGAKPTPMQEWWIAQLRKRGHDAFVVSSEEQFKGAIQ